MRTRTASPTRDTHCVSNIRGYRIQAVKATCPEEIKAYSRCLDLKGTNQGFIHCRPKQHEFEACLAAKNFTKDTVKKHIPTLEDNDKLM